MTTLMKSVWVAAAVPLAFMVAVGAAVNFPGYVEAVLRQLAS